MSDLHLPRGDSPLGQGFGFTGRSYHLLRPDYSTEAINWLLEARNSLSVLDLGSGTGRLAWQLERMGHVVSAVEPDARMRRFADGLLTGPALTGTAERIPLGDATVDATLVGQAWHWFDEVRAAGEVGRVLRAGGTLGLLWNIRDESTPWVADLGDITGGTDGSSRLGTWEPTPGPEFEMTGQRFFSHAQTVRPVDLVRLASTWSYVQERSDRADVLRAVRELAMTHPDLVGRTSVPLPYLCKTVRFRFRGR